MYLYFSSADNVVDRAHAPVVYILSALAKSIEGVRDIIGRFLHTTFTPLGGTLF
jgi:hypothetical protein